MPARYGRVRCPEMPTASLGQTIHIPGFYSIQMKKHFIYISKSVNFFCAAIEMIKICLH